MSLTAKEMRRRLYAKVKPSQPTPGGRAEKRTKPSTIEQTSYTSNPVDVSKKFLRFQPHDAHPITVQRIDFAESPLPEYEPYYATVLDNVLSASECQQMLAYAEASSTTGGWAPAKLNAGNGFEYISTDIRHSDR